MIIIGQISDSETFETIPGVNVFVSDKAGNVPENPIGAASDMDGNYVINADYFDYVTFSFIGYSDKTILVTDLQQDTNVLMQPGLSLPIVEILGRKVKKLVWPQVAIAFGLFLFLVFIVLYIKKGS